MYLQRSFKSQLSVSRQLIKDRKLNKQLKQLQSAILNAVAAFERVDQHLPGHDQRLKLNIATRVETLCTEYAKVKTKKHELLGRALAVA